MIQLMLGDCLERMAEIDDGSIDLILADLPYGTTACKWDVVIPFGPLWAHYRRVLKERGAVVLTASQPFTSMLVMSNREWFKYAMVWDKVNKHTDFLNAKKRPLRRHEDVLVFAPAETTYNPQMIRVAPYKSRRSQPPRAQSYGKVAGCDYGKTIDEHNPCTIVEIPSHFTTGVVHPNQKPIALGEYLIRTYSNEGETVLDNTMGSGSFGVAALRTGRNFIGIESDANYFRITERRLEAASTPLFADSPP